MLVALVIVSLLVYLTVQTYRLEYPEIAAARYPSNLRIAVFVLWIFVLIQVVLGTQVRESIEILIRQFPLLSDPELVARVGLVGWIHTLLGIFVAIACWLVGFMIVNRSAQTDPLATQGAWALTGLALIQVILGLILFAVGIPRVVQVLHMWIASMIAGLVLMLLALTKPLKETV
jgi:cytochrome c oxidase assembly protein subunit 15